MFGRRDKDSVASIDTLIGRHVRVNGDIEFAGGLHVEGWVVGSVRAEADADASLSLSEGAVIDGSVAARHVIANGRINGDILASGRVVLGAKAQVRGDVYYSVIEMALGAEISGKLVKSVAAAAALAAPIAVKEAS
jgi:cytoskeletal protein CcmA (bactofilin family)